MKKNTMMYELELSKDILQELYESLGLFDDIEFVYSEFKEYGYTNILDFALDEITNNTTIYDLLHYVIEYNE